MINPERLLNVVMPSRWRITAYLPEDMQKAIEEWAAEENRSISNLAATILINAIKEYQQKKENPSSASGGKEQ